MPSAPVKRHRAAELKEENHECQRSWNLSLGLGTGWALALFGRGLLGVGQTLLR